MDVNLIKQSVSEVARLPEKEVIEKLTFFEQSVVKAQSQGLKVFEMDGEDLLQLATQVTYDAFTRLGHNLPESNDLQVLNRFVLNTIRKYTSLSRNEILLALEMALDGEFLDEKENRIFFSSSNFALWLKKYCEIVRVPVMAKFIQQSQKKADSEVIIPSKEERKARAFEIIENHKKQLEKNPDFDFILSCSSLYDDLVEFELHECSQNEKFIIKEYVLKKYKNLEPAQLAEKCKHEAYKRYIQKLIEPVIEKVEIKINAKPTVKLSY